MNDKDISLERFRKIRKQLLWNFGNANNILQPKIPAILGETSNGTEISGKKVRARILGISREVVLEFSKVGANGKYCSIRHMKCAEFQTGGFCSMENVLRI